MPQIEHNAPGFFYRVFWKRQDSDDGWMMEDIHDWQQTRFVVSNTPAYTPYTIKVEALNSRGQAYTPARHITGYSGEISVSYIYNQTLMEVSNRHYHTRSTIGGTEEPVLDQDN